MKQSERSCFSEGYFGRDCVKRRNFIWVKKIVVFFSRTQSYLKLLFASQHPVDASNFIFLCMVDNSILKKWKNVLRKLEQCLKLKLFYCF